MKREIFATLLVLAFVLRGFYSSVLEVEERYVESNHNIDAYSELINQTIIFEDDFNQSINPNWQIEDGTTKYNRLSTNEAENIKFDDDQLVLTTKVEKDGSVTTPYMTLDTDINGNKFNYGYYEAGIKFTNNNEYDDGTTVIPNTNIYKPWGAFWLYPLENGSEETTEVDIVENSTVNSASASIHELENYQVVEEEQASSWFKGQDYGVNPYHYHRYGVYIEPNDTEYAATYTFYIDGNKVEEIESKQPMGLQTVHLSMEIATEDYQDGLQGEEIKELKQMKEESMFVDYVRVYQYNPDL